ncbi:MAG: family 20 glycosylhydrolase [Clostridia bacterium]|nr:family 20 glycosylhydrolase [Clostridia bacterium]
MIFPRVKKGTVGAYHSINDTVSIYCADAQGACLLTAVREMMPYLSFVQIEKREESMLSLTIDTEISVQAEYYELNITDGKCEICAKDYRGLINAFATLTQLIKCEDGTFSLPDVEICDYPDAAFRSFMTDPARNLVPMDEMRALILSMAKSRLNKLHIHLSDGKGFAYESDIFPDLPPAPGGVYSRTELKEIIDYAGLFGIDVIPEIDVPAHSYATVAWKPQLKCRVKGKDVSSWNMCLGNTATYELIDALLGEIAQIFPYEYIHIGTDEMDMRDIKHEPPLTVSHCEECEVCRSFFLPLGLDSLRERFYWFVRRVYATVTGLGKKMMMWNDDVDISKSPDIPRDILIEFWRVAAEQRGPVEGCSMQRFIEEGFEVVNAYFEDTYLCEYAKWDRLKAWDFRRDPYTPFLGGKQVIGGETCAWEGSNYSHYLYALYFALPAFGDRVWNIHFVTEDEKARVALSRAVLGCDTPDGFDLFAYMKSVWLGDARYIKDMIFADGADLEQMCRVLRGLTNQSKDERLLTERLIAMSQK